MSKGREIGTGRNFCSLSPPNIHKLIRYILLRRKEGNTWARNMISFVNATPSKRMKERGSWLNYPSSGSLLFPCFLLLFSKKIESSGSSLLLWSGVRALDFLHDTSLGFGYIKILLYIPTCLKLYIAREDSHCFGRNSQFSQANTSYQKGRLPTGITYIHTWAQNFFKDGASGGLNIDFWFGWF